MAMEAYKKKIFGGKNKALTFSYDDGVTQDVRLIEIFNKYGLRATFNLNSGLLGKSGELVACMLTDIVCDLVNALTLLTADDKAGKAGLAV